MAVLAVHDRSAPDERFESYFPLVLEGAEDSRNYVKKAVNWALRQVGKRNLNLCMKAIACAEQMAQLPGTLDRCGCLSRVESKGRPVHWTKNNWDITLFGKNSIMSRII